MNLYAEQTIYAMVDVTNYSLTLQYQRLYQPYVPG